jgi:hypothetical protein
LFFYSQSKYFSKSKRSSSNKNNFLFCFILFKTQSIIFFETLFQYKCFSLIISLFQIAHFIISVIRFELIGGAIIFVQLSIVSILSDQNLIVMHGTQTIFASSCIDQLSVTTAQALLIISITSL